LFAPGSRVEGCIGGQKIYCKLQQGSTTQKFNFDWMKKLKAASFVTARLPELDDETAGIYSGGFQENPTEVAKTVTFGSWHS
jgi:hypothetical protein